MDIDNKTIYQNLRKEIMYYTKKQDTCITTTFSLTVSIWTLALTLSKAWIALIPLAIIIPMSIVVCNCRYSIAFLASYMAIFLENNVENGWETLREKYYTKRPNNFWNSMLLFGSKFGFGLLSFVSIFIFVFICIDIDSIDRFTLGHISLLLVLVVLSIIQEIMCIQFSDISIMKCKMMETWSVVYNEQYRI